MLSSLPSNTFMLNTTGLTQQQRNQGVRSVSSLVHAAPMRSATRLNLALASSFPSWELSAAYVLSLTISAGFLAGALKQSDPVDVLLGSWDPGYRTRFLLGVC